MSTHRSAHLRGQRFVPHFGRRIALGRRDSDLQRPRQSPHICIIMRDNVIRDLVRDASSGIGALVPRHVACH